MEHLAAFIIAITSLLSFVLIIVIYISYSISPRKFSFKGRHVLITGGSSGIGKAVAKKAAALGSHVTIVARDVQKLQETVKEIRESIPPCEGEECLLQVINWVSADLSKGPEAVEAAMKEVGKKAPGIPVDVLVNSAGYSVPKAFTDLTSEEIEGMMRLNYFASVDMTRAVLPQMMASIRGGRIIFVSSQAGQTAVYGYTGYSPTKFALRGFAEALQMEVHRSNVQIGICFPPDTDTPGFEEENKVKPQETHLVSESGSLFKPEQVADSIIKGIIKGRFLIWTGFDGWLLCNLTAGMSPVFSVTDAFSQVMMASLVRFISFFYLIPWYSSVSKFMRAKKSKAKTS